MNLFCFLLRFLFNFMHRMFDLAYLKRLNRPEKWNLTGYSDASLMSKKKLFFQLSFVHGQNILKKLLCTTPDNPYNKKFKHYISIICLRVTLIIKTIKNCNFPMVKQLFNCV